MSYHMDAVLKRILIDNNECSHLADEYICTCEASKYYMDVPPDGRCYKDGGCTQYEDETGGIMPDEFCKDQEKGYGRLSRVG